MTEEQSTVNVTENNDETKIKRRTVMKGAVAASAVMSMPMILTGFKKAQAASGPVKIGHIEDLSGNIAVYGVQKWHAAQLAVKEINEGKTLKGGPVGSGGLGSLGKFAGNPPIMGNGDKDLKYVNNGGAQSGSGMVYVEDDDTFIDSGDSGILGREVKLIGPDGQSNWNVWQQLCKKLIQEDKVDCLVAGFTSASREAIRPIVDRYKQLGKIFVTEKSIPGHEMPGPLQGPTNHYRIVKTLMI